jgi:hypothetical protein
LIAHQAVNVWLFNPPEKSRRQVVLKGLSYEIRDAAVLVFSPLEQSAAKLVRHAEP